MEDLPVHADGAEPADDARAAVEREVDLERLGRLRAEQLRDEPAHRGRLRLQLLVEDAAHRAERQRPGRGERGRDRDEVLAGTRPRDERHLDRPLLEAVEHERLAIVERRDVPREQDAHATRHERLHRVREERRELVDGDRPRLALVLAGRRRERRADEARGVDARRRHRLRGFARLDRVAEEALTVASPEVLRAERVERVADDELLAQLAGAARSRRPRTRRRSRRASR